MNKTDQIWRNITAQIAKLQKIIHGLDNKRRAEFYFLEEITLPSESDITDKSIKLLIQIADYIIKIRQKNSSDPVLGALPIPTYDLLLPFKAFVLSDFENIVTPEKRKILNKRLRDLKEEFLKDKKNLRDKSGNTRKI